MGLVIYYLITDFYIALFLIPIISEFFFKKFSLVFYLALIIPLILDSSVLTFSLAYSILLVRVFGLVVRDFGRGDIKVLQTVAVTIPLYPSLPTLDSLFPPVLAVTLMASIMGVCSTLYVYARNRGTKSSDKLLSISSGGTLDKNKFWIRGDKAVYKIPFVTLIGIGFAILFILSLLRLV